MPTSPISRSTAFLGRRDVDIDVADRGRARSRVRDPQNPSVWRCVGANFRLCAGGRLPRLCLRWVAFDAAKSGGVIVAAIAAVFTIGYVANRLGEDELWLHELSIDMFPEDGCLHVYGVGDDGVTAFTEYGIECLQQIIADERAARNAPPQVKSTK
jgi:hypothetical protein